MCQAKVNANLYMEDIIIHNVLENSSRLMKEGNTPYTTERKWEESGLSFWSSCSFLPVR